MTLMAIQESRKHVCATVSPSTTATRRISTDCQYGGKDLWKRWVLSLEWKT